MGLRIRLVDITTFKYAKVLATSKYLINNSSFPAFYSSTGANIFTDMAWNSFKDIREENAFWN